MQKINDLEISVSKLSDKEYTEFRDWFFQQDNDRWDAQIETDISNNKLANIANEALAEYGKGNFKVL